MIIILKFFFEEVRGLRKKIAFFTKKNRL